MLFLFGLYVVCMLFVFGVCCKYRVCILFVLHPYVVIFALDVVRALCILCVCCPYVVRIWSVFCLHYVSICLCVGRN